MSIEPGTAAAGGTALCAILVACVLLLLLFWHWENPYHPRHSCGSTENGLWELAPNPTVRGYIRHVLSLVGFFETFGFVCIVVIVTEAFLYALVPGSPVRARMWKMLVAYVSASHFNYAVHATLGSREAVRRTAGIGGLLVGSREWFLHVLGFNEHRLSDVVVHAGMVLRHPFRLDHWFALCAHVLRYGGDDGCLCRKVSILYGTLSLDDIIDCTGHSISGILLLGWDRMLLAIITVETFRRLLGGQPGMHHSWSRKRLRDSQSQAGFEPE